MKTLFFELIQVAIGRRDALSRVPSDKEWCEFYGLSVKQALTGVCFCGVQRLAKNQVVHLPKQLMMQWFAQAEQIRQRNVVMNRRCVEVQRMLAEDGLRSSILKGQGVARLYRIRNKELGVRNDSQLGMYRQSGDIDVYVPCGMERGLRRCRERYGDVEYDYINAHVPMFKDVEVELHWRVGSMTNQFRNRRLQRWLERDETKEMILDGKANLNPETSLNPETLLKPETPLKPETSLSVPTLEFNAFYLMLHCYHHVFESGLGLRQLMDYYFLLMARNNLDLDLNLNNRKTTTEDNFNLIHLSTEHTDEHGDFFINKSDLLNLFGRSSDKSDKFNLLTFDEHRSNGLNGYAVVNRLFHEFGMERFVGAVMWIMQEVFGLERERLLCEPDEKEGRFILAEVMTGGNFGHHDERIRKVGKGKWQSVFANLQHAMHVLRRYPQEALWMPVWMVYHFVWKRTKKTR